MKKIRDFKEGDRIRDVYLVKEVKNGTTAKGSPYLTVVQIGRASCRERV